jgi:hypothetical protein
MSQNFYGPDGIGGDISIDRLSGTSKHRKGGVWVHLPCQGVSGEGRTVTDPEVLAQIEAEHKAAAAFKREHGYGPEGDKT